VRAKRPVDAGNHVLWPAHPVQRRIGEHRVELVLEGKRMAVHLLHFEALCSSCGDTSSLKSAPSTSAPRVGDLLRQHTVAAAEVEDAFALPRRQEIEHRTGKLGDETAFQGIVVGLPALHRLRRCHVDRAYSDGPGRQGS
jgi:hypothetical protein